MHGLGNDFMVVDATRQPFRLMPAQIQTLADRHRGVGFDQLLILAPSQSGQADFAFLIFNNDGSVAEQCGNGARCMARFIHRSIAPHQRQWRLLTAGKITVVTLEDDETVTVEIPEPYFSPPLIPFITSQESPPYNLDIDDKLITFGVAGVGNPHVVIPVDDVKLCQIEQIGSQISKHPSFPEGVNVGFMQIMTPDHILLRVYERGAGPTLACGSGACAAVAVGRQMQKLAERVQVTQPGGELWISWRGLGSTLFMRGTAHFIFEGKISI